MLTFDVDAGDRPLRLLCIGAHCDDIEIGCGGTVLEWLSRHPKVEATWVVLCAHGERAAEARRSAAAFLRRADRRSLLLHPFRDGYFPAQYDQIKRTFADLGATIAPDVVFTHTLEDRHQDHRLVAELTWQTFRDHLVLEFDIPKYEGDSGQHNLFVPLSASAARRKVANLMRHFGSQRSKDWFRPETFAATMHLRGLECRAPSGSAEAFRVRKLVVDRRAARNG